MVPKHKNKMMDKDKHNLENTQKEAKTERQKKTVLLKCAKLPLYTWIERVNE